MSHWLNALSCMLVLTFLSNIVALSSSRMFGLASNIKNKMSSHGILILDGDNIRGKTKFTLSKEDLSFCVEEWMLADGYQGRIILMFDHASQHCSYVLPSGLVVVFAGPDYCADDIIARDVEYIQSQNISSTVLVITDDRELRRRCSKESKRVLKKRGLLEATADQNVHILSSSSFAEFCMQLQSTRPSVALPVPPVDPNIQVNVDVLTRPNFKYVLTEMNAEIDLRRKLAQVQTLLISTNRRNRPRMLSRVKAMEARLQMIHSSRSQDSINTLAELSRIVNVTLPEVNENTTSTDVIFESRYEILSRVLDLLKFDSSHVEDTWERVILAERFRHRLEQEAVQQREDVVIAESSSWRLRPYAMSLNEKYAKGKAIPAFVLST